MIKVVRLTYAYEVESLLNTLKRSQIISITEDQNGYTVIYEVE